MCAKILSSLRGILITPSPPLPPPSAGEAGHRAHILQAIASQFEAYPPTLHAGLRGQAAGEVLLFLHASYRRKDL